MGLPSPPLPLLHPQLQHLPAWGPCLSPLSLMPPCPQHLSMAPHSAMAHSVSQGSRGQAVPAQPHRPSATLPSPAHCSRALGTFCLHPALGWGYLDGRRDALGRQKSLLWEAHQGGHTVQGVRREGQAGGRYLVPSSGFPSPSVFPSSSVFWSSVLSLCCFFRRTHFTATSTRITKAKKPPTEVPTMSATVESCFGGSGERGQGLRASSPQLGQPVGATGNRQGLLPAPGIKPCGCEAEGRQGAGRHPWVPAGRGDGSATDLG